MITLTLGAAIVRMVVALILGILLGLERSVAHKNAGMRTYGLVSLGSCLFVVTSLLVLPQFAGSFNIDPLRLASGVVTGIGFLGAGLILMQNNRLSGLTTAAGLWVACGVGIAAGFGLIEIAAVAVSLALVTFTLLWFIEKKVVTVSDSKKDNLLGPKE